MLPRLTVLPSSSRVPGFCARGSASRQNSNASRPCIQAVRQHSTLRQVKKLTGSHGSLYPSWVCPLRPLLPCAPKPSPLLHPSRMPTCCLHTVPSLPCVPTAPTPLLCPQSQPSPPPRSYAHLVPRLCHHSSRVPKVHSPAVYAHCAHPYRLVCPKCTTLLCTATILAPTALPMPASFTGNHGTSM